MRSSAVRARRSWRLCDSPSSRSWPFGSPSSSIARGQLRLGGVEAGLHVRRASRRWPPAASATRRHTAWPVPSSCSGTRRHAVDAQGEALVADEQAGEGEVAGGGRGDGGGDLGRVALGLEPLGDGGRRAPGRGGSRRTARRSVVISGREVVGEQDPHRRRRRLLEHLEHAATTPSVAAVSNRGSDEHLARRLGGRPVAPAGSARRPPRLRSWLPSGSMVRKSAQLPSAMRARTRSASASSRPAASTSPAKAAATARAPQPSAPSRR